MIPGGRRRNIALRFWGNSRKVLAFVSVRITHIHGETLVHSMTQPCPVRIYMTSRRRSCLWAALLLLGVFAVSPVAGGEASYRLQGGNLPINHSVNGFSQAVQVQDGGRVLVRVGVQAVAVGGDPGGFVPDPRVQGLVPEGFGLPAGLASRLSLDLDAYSRATRVLQWVGHSLSLDTQGTGDQDAFSVLRRGGGRCSGLANTTVALLRAAGFEARTISGLLVSDERVVPHRWLECRIPGAGWVPTDPTMGHWVITPRHVAFGDTVTDLPTVEIVNTSRDQPQYPRVDDVPTRPDRGAELFCRVLNPCGDSLVGVIQGQGGIEFRITLEGEGHFTGLLPGRWRLEVRRDSVVLERRVLDLGSGAHSIAITIDDEDCPSE